MDWKEIDEKLKKDSWHLQINRHYNSWRAIYLKANDIPRSGRGDTMEEAVCMAGNLILQSK